LQPEGRRKGSWGEGRKQVDYENQKKGGKSRRRRGRDSGAEEERKIRGI